MGKLSDDTLQWTLDINGKPAIKELGIVEQETNSLKTANKDLRIEMQKLEAQGKKNSKEYNEMNTQMGKNKETIAQNEKRMEALRKEIGLNSLSTAQLSKRYNELNQQFRRATPNTPEWKKLRTELGLVKGRMNELSVGTGKVNGVFGSLKGLLPVVGFAALAAGAKQLVSKMISVSAEFQKYQAVLSTALGSEREARIEMNNIKDIASKTPFSVNELTDAYVKLVNQGFKPTTEQMIAMGDLASSTGKGFGQLTEAIIDAQTGEFERLKEFGVRAKKEGDQVKFTFKGVETQVAFTNEAIQNYVIGLGQTEGVTGSMAKISGTLGGQISNLGDSWTQLLDTLGSKSGGIFTTVIGWLNNIVSGLKMASMSIEQIKQEVMDSTLKEALINDEKELNDMAISLEEKYKKAGIQLEGMSFKQKAATLLISQYKNLLTSLTPEEEDRKANIVEQIKALEKIAVVQEKVIVKTDEQIKKEKEAADKAAKAADEAVKARQKVLDDLASLEDEYLRSQMDKQNQEIFAVTDKYDKIYEQALAANSDQKTLDAIRAQENLALEDLFVQQKKEADDKKKADEEKHQEQIKAIREKYIVLSAEELQTMELTELQKAYDQKLLSEEEFQIAKKAIEDKYADIQAEKDEKAKEEKLSKIQRYYSESEALASSFQGLYDSFQDAELQKLEKTYDAKIKAAGDNKVLVAKYEEELAAKQKVIAKKKANSEFIITSAKIIGNTALAVSKSVAESPETFGLPWSAFAVATGAIELAVAAKQRQIAMQAKSGRYPVIGADDGKLYHADYYGPLTRPGIINGGRETLINEGSRPEYIIDADTTQNINRLNPAIFSAIEHYRVPQRAEGKFPSTVSTTAQPVDNSVNVALVNAINQLVAQIAPGIKAYVVLSELNTQQDKLTKIQDRASGR